MMELIKPGTRIEFMGRVPLFIGVSLLLILASFVLIGTKNFNFGIDFAGGTVTQIQFDEPVPMEDIRAALSTAIDGEFELQNFSGADDSAVLVRIAEHGGVTLQQLADNIKTSLDANFASLNPQRGMLEQVGPQVGDELRKQAFFAMLYATIGILIYIALRFEFVYGLGAIVALMHDIIITLGVYSLSGKEFNLTVVAAVLTVVGYSLNDKIVIFDRIREKVKSGGLGQYDWKELTNRSINETLSRTILTSVLTFIAVLSLYLFGGEVLNGFALVMMVGIIVGTYSSFAIAASFVCQMRIRQLNKKSEAL